MPERLAKMPATAPLTEVMGSGPFLFKRDEWVPGNKAVFVRNPNYVGRSEPPSGLSGNKKPHFDRVEWLYLPDSNSSTAALKNGEVDLIEQVPPLPHQGAATTGAQECSTRQRIIHQGGDMRPAAEQHAPEKGGKAQQCQTGRP
jgi:ABC-type transport system substrate-binding protein